MPARLALADSFAQTALVKERKLSEPSEGHGWRAICQAQSLLSEVAAANLSKSDVVRERLERAPRKRRRTTSLNAIADLIGSVDNLPTWLHARSSICKTRVTARDVLVDAGFVVALLSSRDNHHEWAATQASEFPRPWSTCEAVLSESFYLLGGRGAANLGALVRRRALLASFEFAKNVEPVLRLIKKHSDVPMSLADACLVRVTETLADPMILTTDEDFRVYRRHSRQVVPCVTPD